MPPSTFAAGPASTHPATLRSRWWLIAAVAVIATLLPPVTPPATADTGTETAFVEAANRERSAQGRSALSTASDLTSVARAHSRRMADNADLHHNPNLGDDVTGWTKVGENVGRGGSVEAIHAALMASASHRHNLLDADWTETGMGVVVADGTVWVTQLFRKPAAQPAASTPTASPEDGGDHSDAEPGDAKAAAPPADAEPATTSRAGADRGDGDAAPTDRPLPMDRTTLTLARRAAAAEGVSAGDRLIELYEAAAGA